MSSSERITEAELARSRKARDIAKNWLLAETTRLELAGLDPAIGEATTATQMRPSKFGRPSPLDRVREARVSGMEVRSFEQGLAGEINQSKTQPTSSDVAGAKSRIVEALIKAGKSPTEITEYLDKISSHLDVLALSTDPAVQSILFSRVMSGSSTQTLGMKDVIETIRLVSELKQQPQSDPAAMAGAMVNAVKVGIDAAKSSNNGDPLATIAAIAPLYKEMNETQRTILQSQIEGLRSELQQRDPEKYFESIQKFGDLFGWGHSQDTPEIALHKLHSLDEERKRAYEMERLRWEKEWAQRAENLRDKKQSETMGRIISTVQRAIESPVVKEFGKSVGRSIGADKNSVIQAATTAPAAAATAALSNPTDVPWGFTCPKCKVTRTFTQKELALLEERGGNWVCPSPGCGEAYKLQPSSKKPDEGRPSTF